MEEFLKKTECHFNWNLSAIDVTDLSWVEKLRGKIEENQSLDDPSELIWPLKLTYAYELFATDKEADQDREESAKVVEDVIKEIEEARDGLTSKYRTSYVHIAYSFKAFTLVESKVRSGEVGDLIERIKPIAEMSRIEKSAVLAMQAQILSYYAQGGVCKGLPLQREAIRMNPEEIEFKLSLVISMHRKRNANYSSSRTQITWSDVEEPVSILEQLLHHPELTSKQRVSCEYFLALAYSHYLRTLKPYSTEYKECKLQILKSCDWIHDKSNHPQILAFCACEFFYLEKNSSKGLNAIEAALEKYPLHVGVNAEASKIYESMDDLNSAAKHAQIALDGGGYLAAWLLLRLKTKLNEEFDDEAYFDKLLAFFPRKFMKHIHLSAYLYYLHLKCDVVKGAQHLEMVLVEDPSYNLLSCCSNIWIKGNTYPLETAYGRIVEALKTTGHCREDLSTLRRVKDLIEDFADVSSFGVSSQTDAPGKREDETFGGRTTPPNARAARRLPIFSYNWRTDRPSASNTSEGASKLTKGCFFQRTSEAYHASTNSRSIFSNQEASSYSSAAFNLQDLKKSGGSSSIYRAPIERSSASNGKESGANQRASTDTICTSKFNKEPSSYCSATFRNQEQAFK